MAHRLLRAFSAVLVVLALFMARAPLPCQESGAASQCAAEACTCPASCTCHTEHVLTHPAPTAWCHPAAPEPADLKRGAVPHVALAPIRYFALPAAWPPALALARAPSAPLSRTPYRRALPDAPSHEAEPVPKA